MDAAPPEHAAVALDAPQAVEDPLVAAQPPEVVRAPVLVAASAPTP